MDNGSRSANRSLSRSLGVADLLLNRLGILGIEKYILTG